MTKSWGLVIAGLLEGSPLATRVSSPVILLQKASLLMGQLDGGL